MRILMVSARYYPFVGGTETHVHEVGTRLAGMGHSITVLTTDPHGSLPTEELVCPGMRIKRVRAYPPNRDYYFSPRIYTEISQAPCDLIHFQGYNNFVAPIGMLAAIRRKVPFVLTFHSGGHSSRLRNAIRGPQQVALSPLVARAAHLIGVSDREAAFFSKRMRINEDRFTVIPNGAELPPPSDPPPALEPHLVLSVGRLERYKGHHRVIGAFPALRERVPDASLKVVGSGPYKADLIALVRKLRLESCVSFVSIPPHDRQYLANILFSAGLIVLLSEQEAHPVAVLEALSAGRPVLVSDAPGLQELARAGLCRSVPLDSGPSGVAAAIAVELTARHDNMERVSLPTWDDCVSQILQVYNSVSEETAAVPDCEEDNSIIVRHYGRGP